MASAAPHELWTAAAAVLAKVLHGGSLKSLLAPMPSHVARPVNALVTEMAGTVNSFADPSL